MKLSMMGVLLTAALAFLLLAAPSTGDAAARGRRHNPAPAPTPHACGVTEPHSISTQQDIQRALAANPPGANLNPPAVDTYRDESDRGKWYIAQVTSYTCGPSVMAMALADHSLHAPPTLTLVQELTRETGTDPCDGMPDWWTAMPPVLQKHGLNTKNYVFDVGDPKGMDALDAELLQGHSAIVHVDNPRTNSGNGHFIYITGKTRDGRYVIGNPDKPANSKLGHDKPITRAQVENMMLNPPKSHPKSYKGVPGFVAVW